MLRFRVTLQLPTSVAYLSYTSYINETLGLCAYSAKHTTIMNSARRFRATVQNLNSSTKYDSL